VTRPPERPLESPLPRTVAGLALALLCTALWTFPASALPTGATLDLFTGTSAETGGSGVLLGTTGDDYDHGTHFPFTVNPGPTPGTRRLELSDFTVPRVQQNFGQNTRFRVLDANLQPTDRLDLILDLDTGHLESPNPLILEMSLFLGSTVVAVDNIFVPITTGSINIPQCGDVFPNTVSGVPIGRPSGRVRIVGALCIAGFDENPAFRQVMNLRLVVPTLGSACFDGIDNDGDGLIDTDDPSCNWPSGVSEAGECFDGFDNDGDTLIDFPSDPGCSSANDTSERGSAACDDGLDNDGDNRVDFPEDRECKSPSYPSEFVVCSDNIDNDGDGAIDFPGDAGCQSLFDRSETERLFICDDGLDNDFDGLVDQADPGCSSAQDPSENDVCSDNVDNDGDGLIDFGSDPGCASPSDANERSSSACDDGFDNDGDGQTDFPDDPDCGSAADDSEDARCDNGLDDDGDGQVDFPNDEGCSSANDPEEFDSFADCDDGLDNDGDTFIDFPNDPECEDALDTSELGQCSNGSDDDGDGRIDFPSDAGCVDSEDSSELNASVACDDGADNDGDTLIDFPSDPDCTSPVDISEESTCDNALDDDGDARIDFPDDPGCFDAADSSERDFALACDDGIDNDGDGDIDLADADCEDGLDASEGAVCDDGLDNDGDTLIDFPSDPGCADAADASELGTVDCDDGEDNDFDGQSDFPGDIGCTSPSDDSEASACSDGADNDGDGQTDFPDDPGCANADDSSEIDSALACDDGLDNDGDGDVDLADAGCTDLMDGSESEDAEITDPAVCSDDIDNDGDGLTDSADPGCEDDEDVSERDALLSCDDGFDNDLDGDIDFGTDAGCDDALDPSESPVCSDARDNDGDGLIDLADAGCQDADDSSETSSLACDDGVDNDMDGETDYPSDPGCSSVSDDSEAATCEDGQDNDGDTLIDFPSDPGCAAANDSSERDGDTDCDDGVDNDSDNETDFPADDGCADPSDTSELGVCADGLDQDGDGLVDLADPGCSDLLDTSETSAVHCDDAIDNDGDGFVDFPEDLGCTSPTDANENAACGDSEDSDGDGFVDFPADPGCTDLEDPSELAAELACDDGVDNDSDGEADGEDSDCIGPLHPSERAACDDGLDNDGDGGIDLDDPGCNSASDTSELGSVQCDDGQDNNGNGDVDFPEEQGCRDAADNSEAPDCLDQVDNDGDGTFDNPFDFGCQGFNDPTERSIDFACDDGFDNDSDGLIDTQDPQCASPQGVSESPTCSDGVDNDRDGFVDFGADPGCQSVNDSSELSSIACDDGVDNDFDGAIDLLDTGCESPTDNSERGACEDSLDNDGDGLVDLADPGCVEVGDPSERSPALECDDGVDNDGDGNIDLADPNCNAPGDPSEDACGNGQIDPGEVCDDGNANDSDCCSTSCQPAPQGTSCTDANACTSGDSCNSTGICQPGPPLACNDGQFCNGTETCNALVGCVAGSPPPIDDGIACTADSCDEVADVVVHAPQDGLCDNGAFCDGAEVCVAGIGCQDGPPPTLDDGVSCTIDGCNDLVDLITHTPVDSQCDDGQFCNGSETCDPTLDCQPGTPPILDDGVSCTNDSCNETTDQVVHTPVDSACSDGQFCNGNETCDAGLGCLQGSPPSLDDGIECTSDSCNETTDQVVHAPVDSACSDGQFCNGSEVCQVGIGCQPGVAPPTDDGVGCTVDSCDEGGDQIVHVAQNALCDDGQFCNGAEICDPVLDCQLATPPPVDDGIPCTLDSCDEESDQAVHTPQNELCDNGIFCDGTEACVATLGCVPGELPNPDDGISCTNDSCNEASDQIEHTPDSSLCGEPSSCMSSVCDAVLGCLATPIPGCIDLNVVQVTGPAQANPSTPLGAVVSVSNQGSADPAPGPIEIDVVLSADSEIDLEDARVGDCQVASLPIGATANCISPAVSIPAELFPPSGGRQTYRWGACASLPGSSVPERCAAGNTIELLPEPLAGLLGASALLVLAALRRRGGPGPGRHPTPVSSSRPSAG